MENISTFAIVLINLGLLIAFAGVLVKNPMHLRLLMGIGAVIFMVGYAAASENIDLFGVAWAFVFAIVNIAVFVKLSLAKSTGKFSQREKLLYSAFRGMEPDEFKQLLAITHWHEATDHTRLTSENEVCDSLFYVLQGKIEVSKEDNMFTLSSNTFIGEVGYFLRTGASATTLAQRGALYVSWKASELRDLESNVPGVRSTIYELLNKDMANKVAASMR